MSYSNIVLETSSDIYGNFERVYLQRDRKTTLLRVGVVLSDWCRDEFTLCKATYMF